MAGSCCAQRFQGGGGSSATFPPRSPPFPLRHCCTGTFRQRMGSTRPDWQHRAASAAGVWSRPLQVQGYAGDASATLDSTLPPSRLSHMLVPSSHVSAAFLSSVPSLNGNIRPRHSNALPFPLASVAQQARGSPAASAGRASAQWGEGSRTSPCQG